MSTTRKVRGLLADGILILTRNEITHLKKMALDKRPHEECYYQINRWKENAVLRWR
jgi:hypothetical protein